MIHAAGARFDRFLQLFHVLPQHFLSAERITEKFKKRSLEARFVIRERIEDTKADATIPHQAAVLEVDQMTGNVRLRSFHDVLDVATTELAVQQQIEYAEPGRVRQSLEIISQSLHVFYSPR